jgi:hypothetical protein
VISATSVFKDSRVAFINNRRAYEGDEIDGVIVVSIKLDGVRLRYGGEEKFFRLE